MAQSPIVLIGGAAATLLKGRGSLQDIDQISLLKPIVKYCATCTRVSDIVPTLRQAFHEAISGVPGPVFVEFPIDILYSMSEVLLLVRLISSPIARELTTVSIPR
jgi:thiamine pyrophosphate-dependent acetolactate synthase large subunit-like protein